MTSVAIVHDYLTQRGGAERVVLAMAEAFPDAPVYTAVYDPDATFPEFAACDVRLLWTDRVPGLRADHRRGLPLYPLAFSRTVIDAEVTLCSSSGFAHGVRATGTKVVYCHTPARWLYDEADLYLATWPVPVRLATRVAGGPLRRWDRRAARSADVTLANSTVVRERIARHYGITAEVLPPPVVIDTDGPQTPVPGLAPGFLLVVGRLLAYKHVDAVVAAAARMREVDFVVVGDGPERDRIAAAAGANVHLLGTRPDAELRWCYAHCAGVVSASHEDFGLTPVEGTAFGKPAAVLRRGGFLDTVVDGRTGVFFDALEPAAVAASCRVLLDRDWDTDALRAHAARYSNSAFVDGLRRVTDADVASVARAP
ncbi:MAG: glycosyltransferase [Actinomycetota bacterium]